jgi:hypothetical protein
MRSAGPHSEISSISLSGTAAAAVPDKLIDEICLCGPAERIRDRLAAWQDAAKSGHLGTMVLKGASIEAMRVVAEAAL